MKIKTAGYLLVVTLLSSCACTTKKTSTHHETRDYKSGHFANVAEPMSPAEGPRDVALSPAPPAEGPLEDMTHNPAVVPSPLLRGSAAASP